MPGDAPLASIIILAKNEERNIGNCLNAIFAQKIASAFEVIVIDSGSTDRTVEIARSFDVRLEEIAPDEFHHARTRNFGASLARGEYLVYLTADATPLDESWLANLLRGIESPDVAGTYGRQVARSWSYPMERYFLSQLYPETPRRQTASDGISMNTTWFSNVNSAIKRSIWERIPFDESSVMTEDQIWSRRALEEGYALLYNPDAAVMHSHNYSLAKAFRRYFDSGMTSEQSYLSSGNGAMRRLGGDGLRYLGGEMSYLARQRQFLWMPYALLYEAAKFAGIVAGRQHERIPSWLVRSLSHNTREVGEK
jgi:rhamnosyltransferase